MTAAAAQVPAVCRQPCEDLIQKGCPRNHCAATIYGGACHPFCSGTFEVAPKIEFFDGKKVFELERKQ